MTDKKGYNADLNARRESRFAPLYMAKQEFFHKQSSVSYMYTFIFPIS